MEELPGRISRDKPLEALKRHTVVGVGASGFEADKKPALSIAGDVEVATRQVGRN